MKPTDLFVGLSCLLGWLSWLFLFAVPDFGAVVLLILALLSVTLGSYVTFEIFRKTRLAQPVGDEKLLKEFQQYKEWKKQQEGRTQ